MSIELKALQQVSFGDKLADINFSFPRDPVPTWLQERGVSLYMWMSTYDAVIDQYRYLVGDTSPIECWMYFPCFLPCTFPYMAGIEDRYNRAWVDLAAQQNESYRPYGVRVSVAMSPFAFSGATNSSNERVGLRFELLPARSFLGAAAAACASETADASVFTRPPPYAPNLAAQTPAHSDFVTIGLTDDDALDPVASAPPIPANMQRPPLPVGNTGCSGTTGGCGCGCGGCDWLEQLERIAALHKSGELTDAEYELTKSKILPS